MATQHYRFQARNERGELVAGVLQADSVAGAAALLRARGDHVVQLVPMVAAGEDFRAVLKKLNYASGPSQKDILDFTTQLAVMIRAGISIRAALEVLLTATRRLCRWPCSTSCATRSTHCRHS